MALVVGVPDPDVAAILDDTGVGRGLHAQGLKGPQRRLDLFAALHLHGDGHSVHGIHHRQGKAMADLHGLGRGVKHAGKQIGQAAGNAHLDMLALPGDQVSLVQNRLALAVVEPKCGIYAPAAFHRLLVELITAALVAVKGGLEVVAYVEEHIDGADGVAAYGEALAVACRPQNALRRWQPETRANRPNR